MAAVDYTAFDVALERLRPYGDQRRDGLTNHAPMAVEALCVLGRGDAAGPWVAAYEAALKPRGTGRQPVGADWAAALGAADRYDDWVDLFVHELARDPWPVVLERWTFRLAPGYAAGALHGVIRVGHSVRALTAGRTPARLQELADGLASWAASWQTLPAAAWSGPRWPLAEAVPRIPLLPVAQRRGDGPITTALGALAGLPAFAPVIDALAPPDDVGAALPVLAAGFAQVFPANVGDWLGAVVFTHGLTGLWALHNLLPHLSPQTAQEAFRHAWQASAALQCAYGTARGMPSPGAVPGPAELIERAVATRDEHGFKLADACLGFAALHAPAPFLAALDHALPFLAET